MTIKVKSPKDIYERFGEGVYRIEAEKFIKVNKTHFRYVYGRQITGKFTHDSFLIFPGTYFSIQIEDPIKVLKEFLKK